MSNKPGYKHTPLGWLPEEWEICDFEKLCSSLVRGPFGGALKKEVFTKNGYKVYEQKNAIYKDYQLGSYFINDEKFKELSRFSVEPGNFLVSCSGTIGKIYKVPIGAPQGIINQALLKITCNEKEVDPNFFQQYFEWDGFQKRIIDNSQGGAMQNLVGMELFRQLPCSFPKISEQRRIAAILCAWDEAITKTQQLLGQLQQRNNGLMQLLFTDKINLKGFEGKWKRLHIYDVAKEISLKNRENKQLTVLSCTKYNGLVPSLEYFGRRVFGSDTSTYKVVPLHHFAYATNHIEEGSIGYQSIFSEALISPMYTVFKTDGQVNDDYFFKLLKSHYYIHEYCKRMEGSIDRRGGLRWDEFSKIVIHLPDLKQQVAIVTLLNKAIEEVNLYEQNLVALQQQKKGLMQKLLTGEVRSKINK